MFRPSKRKGRPSRRSWLPRRCTNPIAGTGAAGGIGGVVRLGVGVCFDVVVAPGVDGGVGVGVAVDMFAGAGVANAVAGAGGRRSTIPRSGIVELAQPDTATRKRRAAIPGDIAWSLRGQNFPSKASEGSAGPSS